MVTQLRAPLGRILSAYEFAVEVAARTLIRAKDHKPDPSRVNTRNVWPWSALVPIIEEDLLMRVRVHLNCILVVCLSRVAPHSERWQKLLLHSFQTSKSPHLSQTSLSMQVEADKAMASPDNLTAGDDHINCVHLPAAVRNSVRASRSCNFCSVCRGSASGPI